MQVLIKVEQIPISFPGLHDEGIEILLKIKKELDLCIVTKLLTINQVKKYAI